MLAICNPTSSRGRKLIQSILLSRGWSLRDIESSGREEEEEEIDLIWTASRDVDWNRLLSLWESGKRTIVSSYLLKTGLVRKAELFQLAERSKRQSDLISFLPPSIVLRVNEGDSSDSDSSSDSEDENEKEEESIFKGKSPLERKILAAWKKYDQDGGKQQQKQKQQRWLLKASESNRGENIHIFDVDYNDEQNREEMLKKCREIFDSSDEKGWLLQRYVQDPLLVREGRKFHVRAHILAVGDLKIFLHDEPMCLLASAPLLSSPPSHLFAHLTNHCVQLSARRGGAEGREEGGGDDSSWNENNKNGMSMTLTQLCNEIATTMDADTLRETLLEKFKMAASSVFSCVRRHPPSFFPTHSSFELFGLDFLVDSSLQVFLLEVNSDPSLAVFDGFEKQCASMLSDLFDVVQKEYPFTRGEGQQQEEQQQQQHWRAVCEFPSKYSTGADSAKALGRLLRVTARLQSIHSSKQQQQKSAAAAAPSNALGKMSLRERMSQVDQIRAVGVAVVQRSFPFGRKGFSSEEARLDRVLETEGWKIVSVEEALDSGFPLKQQQDMDEESGLVAEDVTSSRRQVEQEERNRKMEWALHRNLHWDRVLSGNDRWIANHFLVRNGLLRPTELFTALHSSEQESVGAIVLPSISFATDKEGEQQKQALLAFLKQQGGVWLLTCSQSGGGFIFLMIDSSDENLSIPPNSVSVLCQRWAKTSQISSKLAVAQVIVGARLNVWLRSNFLVCDAPPKFTPVSSDSIFFGLVGGDSSFSEQSLVHHPLLLQRLETILKTIFSTMARRPKDFLPLPNAFEVFTIVFSVDEREERSSSIVRIFSTDAVAAEILAADNSQHSILKFFESTMLDAAVVASSYFGKGETIVDDNGFRLILEEEL